MLLSRQVTMQTSLREGHQMARVVGLLRRRLLRRYHLSRFSLLRSASQAASRALMQGKIQASTILHCHDVNPSSSDNVDLFVSAIGFDHDLLLSHKTRSGISRERSLLNGGLEDSTMVFHRRCHILSNSWVAAPVCRPVVIFGHDIP